MSTERAEGTDQQNAEGAEQQSAEGTDQHNLLKIFVFIVIFWPLSLVLGVMDTWFFPEHDLRFFNIVLAGLVGWLGVRYFFMKWGKLIL